MEVKTVCFRCGELAEMVCNECKDWINDLANRRPNYESIQGVISENNEPADTPTLNRR